MSFDDLKQRVYKANMQLVEMGLVFQTFGNASAIDRELGVFGIKPSGVAYDQLRPEDIVILDVKNQVVEGSLRPSSDTKTHAYLYQSWDSIGGIVHTHSTYATSWAQTQQAIPILGTTHADHTTYDIPCAPVMDDEWIAEDYETMTGRQIVDHLITLGYSHADVEMMLISNHGPFTWAPTIEKAVYNSAVLEKIAELAYLTLTIRPDAPSLKSSLIQKHYDRKHGKTAYYGQQSLKR